MQDYFNIFFFNKVLNMSIITRNAVLKDNKQILKNIGWADQFGPLSTPFYKTLKNQHFCALYTRNAYNSRVYNTGAPYGVVTKRGSGINYLRGRSRFVNKFTRHGAKARSQHAFARALAFFYIMLRSNITINDFRLTEGFMDTINIKKIIRYKKIGYFLKQKFISLEDVEVVTSTLFCDSIVSLENTEFIFKQMTLAAPTYAIDVTRVSKKIYKSTRGKSGKYVIGVRPINKNRCLPFMFRQLKRTWRFSKNTTFLGKYIEVLYEAAFFPEESLPVYLGNRAVMERKF